MHLDILTRGEKMHVDHMIRDLQAQYFKYGNGFVQMGVRPIQLWELIFPEENLEEVCATVFGKVKLPPSIKEDKKNLMLTALRKALLLKKLPKMDLTNTPARIISTYAAGAHPIGIRKDKLFDGKHKFAGLEQL